MTLLAGVWSKTSIGSQCLMQKDHLVGIIKVLLHSKHKEMRILNSIAPSCTAPTLKPTCCPALGRLQWQQLTACFPLRQ